MIKYQIITIRLAGEEAVYTLWFQPFIAQGFLGHLLQTRIEFRFEFFPVFAVRVLRAPGQAVKLVEAQMFEDDFQRHILNNALSPLEGMLNRLRLDLGARGRFPMLWHL